MERSPRKPERLIPAGLAILLFASLVVAWRVGAFSTTSRASHAGSVLTQDVAAPELAGLSRWFNSTPLTLKGLRGKVVLVDFWTYSCINCIRELPELRALYGAYRSSGLEILGVHSPEFGFEKIPGNVGRAVKERNVTWPVAMDNELDTWNAFGNQYWPHLYLIDRSGHIRFDHIGEGGTPEVESAIRELLATPGSALPQEKAAKGYALNRGITSELYLGYERGEGRFLGNGEGYVKDGETLYRLPSNSVIEKSADRFFLSGRWKALRESVVSGAAASIALPFTARDVYIVAGAQGVEDLAIKIDGHALVKAQEGASIVSGKLRVAGKDLYHVVHLSGVETHRLDLTPLHSGVSVYTFTFG
ncbi:MAG: hypothetical protein NVSMB57_03730 [Actinomycetota bacterium]